MKLPTRTIINSDLAAPMLRQARLDSGKSLREVAAAMGISDGYLCDLENGRRVWTETRADDYLAAIKTSKTKMKKPEWRTMTDIFGENARAFVASAARDGWQVIREDGRNWLCGHGARIGVVTSRMIPSPEIIGALNRYRNGAYQDEKPATQNE